MMERWRDGSEVNTAALTEDLDFIPNTIVWFTTILKSNSRGPDILL